MAELTASTGTVPVTIPRRGFNHIIRVGYWINAENNIGSQADVNLEMYFTSWAGYGPDANGVTMRHVRASRFREPWRLIALADGVCAGRQRDTMIGTPNIRIGYRHWGQPPTANVLFADGHVEGVAGDRFPRGLGGQATLQEVREDNLSGGPTLYANPRRALAS